MKSADKHKLGIYIKALRGVLKWPFVCKNWYLGVLSYLGRIPNSESVTYNLWNGLKLSASGNRGDLQVIREVFLHNTYRDSAVDLSQVKVVLDLGAHKGYVAMQLAQLTNENTIVYCFEPEPSNLEHLKKNVIRNGYESKIVIDSSAVSSEDGVFPFFISERTYGHSLEEGHNKPTSQIDVLCKSIRTIVKNYQINNIDLLKMDVEGTEYEILFDLDRGIIRSMKYILVEGHSTENYNLRDMVKFLEKNNFECHIPYIFEATIIAINKNLKN